MHLLYKYPGATLLEDGLKYDWKVFPTVEEGEAEGWFKTYSEASAYTKKTDEPLTRAELETLAKAKNIAFDGRTSDAKLTEKLASWVTANDNS
jgi:hypothetical protein